VLTEGPVGIDGQEAISEAREYDTTERCATGLFAPEQEACSTAYAKVDPEVFSFVTGAGWIPNEEVACSKAFFGFFCKQSGNCDPSGHMRFGWGESRFQATEFDRLVVEDDGTATFAGVGTINDAGEYEFMVHISKELIFSSLARRVTILMVWLIWAAGGLKSASGRGGRISSETE
jgi:hypothetical protein